MMDRKSDLDLLHEAAVDGKINSIKCFISQGIDLNVTDDEHNMTALMIAATAGQIEVLNLLVQQDVDLNAVDINGETALVHAIKARQDHAAFNLLDVGVDVDISDYNGDNALMWAARLNVVEVVKKLLRLHVNVDCSNGDGVSALYLAYEAGMTEVVMAFLEHGLLDHQIDVHGSTLLILTARLGDVDLVNLLVQKNANLNVQNVYKFSALMAAVQHQHFDIIQILIEAGAHLDLTNKYGDTALTVACRDGSLHIVKILLDYGASLEEGGNMQITPLMSAAFRGQLDVVYELLQRSADVNATNVDGESALTALCHSTHAFVHDTSQMLVEHGADVNLQDCNGLPALFKAIVNNKTDFAQTLICLGADVNSAVCNTRFRRKETPLITASKMGRTEVVRCLLKHNANVNALDRYCSSALNVAAARSDDQDGTLVSLLAQAGADLNYADGGGMTSLMIASSIGSVNAVRCLIETGACVNTRHYVIEYSALSFATEKKYNDVVEILMLAGAEVRNELHVAVRIGAENIVRTLVMNGAMPVCLDTKQDTSVVSKVSKTPFFQAVLYAEVSIANYFDSLWFFNHFDTREILRNKFLQRKKQKEKTSELLSRLASQPHRLVVLSFVAVSSAVGFDRGREQRVNKLSVPTVVKKRLMFQDDNARLPVEKWTNFDHI